MEPKYHTIDTLIALIKKNIEPQTAEDVLTALTPLNGQLITTRLLDKLPGGRVEWRLSRQMGWTEIKNRAYISTGGDHRDGINLILARSEASVPLDVAFVERENAGYFATRRERNARRAQHLADPTWLSRVVLLMNEMEDAEQRHRAAKKQFVAFIEPSPDRYDLERTVGLREEKK